MKIIVGLGNPGKKYRNNRHNLGFMVIDKLSSDFDIPIAQKKFNSEYGKKDSNLLLVKPTTFMNESGKAVTSWTHYYKIQLEDVLVICDDFTLESGILRFRRAGTSGGHNGLNSIISCLGSNQFPRLRMGIGLPKEAMVKPFPDSGKKYQEDYAFDFADYVLQDFNKDEEDYVKKMIDYAPKLVLEFIENGIESAMNKYNNRLISNILGHREGSE